ncbi:uncharacterized protein PSFLO_05035 [Pseudozyma flocculosa]|uniref:Uncharacterized protein n=1 Tax=Pseudozyma flocculosa TaxID=84751 RepID=A0A5C3F4X2_9BASI|nr:uncharacterized protein PSFLO_05035 [Pseudozyma flocculosa]
MGALMRCVGNSQIHACCFAALLVPPYLWPWLWLWGSYARACLFDCAAVRRLRGGSIQQVKPCSREALASQLIVGPAGLCFLTFARFPLATVAAVVAISATPSIFTSSYFGSPDPLALTWSLLAYRPSTFRHVHSETFHTARANVSTAASIARTARLTNHATDQPNSISTVHPALASAQTASTQLSRQRQLAAPSLGDTLDRRASLRILAFVRVRRRDRRRPCLPLSHPLTHRIAPTRDGPAALVLGLVPGLDLDAGPSAFLAATTLCRCVACLLNLLPTAALLLRLLDARYCFTPAICLSTRALGPRIGPTSAAHRHYYFWLSSAPCIRRQHPTRSQALRSFAATPTATLLAPAAPTVIPLPRRNRDDLCIGPERNLFAPTLPPLACSAQNNFVTEICSNLRLALSSLFANRRCPPSFRHSGSNGYAITLQSSVRPGNGTAIYPRPGPISSVVIFHLDGTADGSSRSLPSRRCIAPLGQRNTIAPSISVLLDVAFQRPFRAGLGVSHDKPLLRPPTGRPPLQHL